MNDKVTFSSDFLARGDYPCTVTCNSCGAKFERVSRNEVHPDTNAHRSNCPGAKQ
jgi:hypothetical protein